MSSVQSAWEDLVVENPNRAKLEACLLTTIMLVVLCIFALLTYVYVQLQPAGNVVTRPLFWKTKFGESFPDHQFAYRMMGWMNWSSTRCLGFSEWACGGRLVEASSLAVYETAEMAAETYAKEYTIELMDRNDAYYTTSPTSDYSNLNASEFGVLDNSFIALTQFFRACRRGYPTMKEFLESYKTTFGLMFVTNADAIKIWDLFKLWQKNFSYYPLGDMYLTTAADKDAKLTGDEYITVEPIRLIARPNDKTNKRYQSAVTDGFRSINIAVKGCCADNGEAALRFEKMIIEELDKETVEDVDMGGLGGIKIKGPQVDMCVETNTLSTNAKVECRYRQRRVAEAIKEVHGTSAADAINWAVLKFFIMLAPLMPADEPDLKNFFKLVAWYHRRAEMPHRDLLCMDLAAKFFPHALEALFDKDDFLNATKVEMLEVLKKLDAEFSGGTVGGKSAGPLTVFTGQLFGDKSPFNNKVAKKISDKITESWKTGYDRIVFFGPPDQHRPNVPPSNSTDPLKLIYDVLQHTPLGNGSESWLGSRFSGDAYYDIRKDRIFAPIGLAMPPYYHFDGGKTYTVKHSMPAYATKLCKALVERFVKGFYKSQAGSRVTTTARELDVPIGLPNAEQQRISTIIAKEVTCFGKEVSPQLMWDLYFTKSGLSLAYQIWRKGYNHATANTDTQLRINYIKFMSEEMLFFVTAANGICNAANPALAAKKDVELAPKVVNSVVHCPLLGDTMLCDKSRPVFNTKCSGLFNAITRADEALFTVEAWRQSKRVKWSY